MLCCRLRRQIVADYTDFLARTSQTIQNGSTRIGAFRFQANLASAGRDGFQNAGSVEPRWRLRWFRWLTRAREYQIARGFATHQLKVQERGSCSSCALWRAMGASVHAPFLRLSRLLGPAAAAGQRPQQRIR